MDTDEHVLPGEVPDTPGRVWRLRRTAVEIDSRPAFVAAGVRWGRPRKLGGDLLGVDVNIAARVGEAAKAGDLLVSDAAVELLDPEHLRIGRRRRLRADGAPREMHVMRVSRRS
jgi:class 3 adenylate cyclase